MKRFFLPCVQAFIVLIPVAVMGWLVCQAFVPSGVFAVTHRVNELSPFIDRVLPDTRAQAPFLEEDGDWAQSIIGEPVYFFAHPHLDFDRADVEVWFKNTGVPVVELGALVNVVGEVYDLKPIQNLRLDQSPWARLEQDGLVLLQRESAYDSVAAFLADPPDRSRIATYHYTLTQPYRIPGYQPSESAQTVDVSLRGFHEFSTYIKDETLRFDVRFMDMNRKNGSDPVSALIFNEDGQPVAEAREADDGNVSDDARPSGLRELSFLVPSLPEGVYKVQLKAERDIFFRRITTTQRKLTFSNNLYLADEIAYREPNRPVRFWTEAKHLRFVTQHAESVQEIQVGDGTVRVPEPYREERYEVPEAGVVRVDVPRGDAIVRSDGHMAFSPEAWFNPDPIRFASDTDLDRLDVDFVIAQYTPPEMVDEWFVQTVSFDALQIARDGGTWKFAISAPGIEEAPGALFLGAINMTWEKEPLTWGDFIGEIGKAIWNR